MLPNRRRSRWSCLLPKLGAAAVRSQIWKRSDGSNWPGQLIGVRLSCLGELGSFGLFNMCKVWTDTICANGLTLEFTFDLPNVHFGELMTTPWSDKPCSGRELSGTESIVLGRSRLPRCRQARQRRGPGHDTSSTMWRTSGRTRKDEKKKKNW